MTNSMCVVTGGAGFIGCALSGGLVQRFERATGLRLAGFRGVRMAWCFWTKGGAVSKSPKAALHVGRHADRRLYRRLRTGEAFGIEFLKTCDQTYGWAAFVRWVVLDMIRAGPETNGIIVGFMGVIGQALATKFKPDLGGGHVA